MEKKFYGKKKKRIALQIKRTKTLGDLEVQLASFREKIISFNHFLNNG